MRWTSGMHFDAANRHQDAKYQHEKAAQAAFHKGDEEKAKLHQAFQEIHDSLGARHANIGRKLKDEPSHPAASQPIKLTPHEEFHFSKFLD